MNPSRRWLLSLACGLAALAVASNVAAIEPSERDVEFARIGERTLKLDLYRPTTSRDERAPLVVWVHGGAWRGGSKDDVPVLRWLERGFAIASVEYRLSPEAPSPAQVHDLKAAIRFLRAKADHYGLDPEQFVVAGASAGGHLAALVGVSDGVAELEGKVGEHATEKSSVRAIVSFYGASNLQTILAQSTEHGLKIRVPALNLLLGGSPVQRPEAARLASPVAHVDASDPPLWLVHGDADPQMPLEQSGELAAAYRRLGRPVDLDVVSGGKHGGDEFYSAERLDRLATALVAALAPTADGKTSPADGATGEAGQPLRILFAGSSSTYWNDMPDAVAKVVGSSVAGRIGRPTVAEIAGRSGSDIRVYLEPGFDRYEYGVKRGGTFLQKLRDEKPDLVVLQAVCGFIVGTQEPNADGSPRAAHESHAEALALYCRTIRESGGEPVFYEMGWGRGEKEAEGRKLILELAKRLSVKRYAPCSSAWARVYAARPELKLQHPNDGAHPGDLGHFLNLACFYATLCDSSPEGKLPREFPVWPHLSKEERAARQAELDAAFAKFTPNAYQRGLASWMLRNAGAGFVARVDEDDARYLERTAWETWKEVRAALAAE